MYIIVETLAERGWRVDSYLQAPNYARTPFLLHPTHPSTDSILTILEHYRPYITYTSIAKRVKKPRAATRELNPRPSAAQVYTYHNYSLAQSTHANHAHAYRYTPDVLQMLVYHC